MASKLNLYGSVQAFPKAVDPSGMSFAGNFLGGFRSQNPVLLEKFLPLLESILKYDLSPRLARLFHDVENSELAGGVTHYRAIFIKNEADGTVATTPNLWLTAPTVGTIAVWNPTAAADGSVDRIADEATAPAGAAWSSPSSGSPLALASIAAGSQLPLWLRRIIPGGSATTAYDSWTLHIQPSGETAQTWSFFHTLKSTITSVTVSNPKGNEIDLQGDLFTITTKNSADTATDPAGSIVRIYGVGAFAIPRFYKDVEPSDQPMHLRNRSGTFIDQAVRTGTGTFRWNFKPPVPGTWILLFDCGGEGIVSQQTVIVTPLDLV